MHANRQAACRKMRGVWQRAELTVEGVHEQLVCAGPLAVAVGVGWLVGGRVAGRADGLCFATTGRANGIGTQ